MINDAKHIVEYFDEYFYRKHNFESIRCQNCEIKCNYLDYLIKCYQCIYPDINRRLFVTEEESNLSKSMLFEVTENQKTFYSKFPMSTRSLNIFKTHLVDVCERDIYRFCLNFAFE